MLLKLILWGLLIYVIYKVVFQFVLPVFNTTRELKKGFREMQQKMNEQMKQQQQQASTATQPQAPKEPVGDYIDFEEVK
jgi:hypothetical protein